MLHRVEKRWIEFLRSIARAEHPGARRAPGCRTVGVPIPRPKPGEEQLETADELWIMVAQFQEARLFLLDAAITILCFLDVLRMGRRYGPSGPGRINR